MSLSKIGIYFLCISHLLQFPPQRLNASTTKQFLYPLNNSTPQRVHPCPILSFQVEAQPKSRFSGIQCWSEAEVPPQEGFDVNAFL